MMSQIQEFDDRFGMSKETRENFLDELLDYGSFEEKSVNSKEELWTKEVVAESNEVEDVDMINFIC